MAARGVENDRGLERHGTVEAPDIDAGEFGAGVSVYNKPISRTSPDISNVARENTRTELCPPPESIWQSRHWH
jgi:hypothetical protein